MRVALEAREVVTTYDAGGARPAGAESAALRTPPESRPLGRDELRALLARQPDGGAAMLTAMVPLADHARIRASLDESGAEAYWPFDSVPDVDATQLARFCDEFADRLARPLRAAEVASVKFQTQENWQGYVSSGAADFITGEPVNRPMRLSLADPAAAMTHALRPGQDPSVAPLRLGLFGDFGNGLYASREVARRITESAPPYAFHLGDVYYDGTTREFAEYFDEPLAPLLERTELFVLSGNHEMYSRGENFQRYIRDKARRLPGVQRQNAEMFRLRGGGLQVIGLDTMWCGWQGKLGRGNAPRLDQPTRDILQSWLEEGDPDGLTILLSSNEPWSAESADTTDMLTDLEPMLRRGLVDLWFWGNVHHGALYDGWQFKGATEHGFVGSCVGHGGYPFYTQAAPKVPKGVSCRWLERKHRFWPYGGVRGDVGLNGWCELGVSRRPAGWEVSLQYRDWVGRERARATVEKPRGMGPRLVSVEENESPAPGGADWKAR